MTRQRIRPSLKRSIYQDCPCCEGRGLVKTAESMSIEVVRMLALAVKNEHIQRVTVRVNDAVAAHLNNQKRRSVMEMEDAGSMTVQILGSEGLYPEHLEMDCRDGQGERAYLDRQPYFQNMPRFLIHETAVHWIDTFRYLAGPPTRVFADLRRMNPVIAGEDAGYILFDQGDGVRSVFDGNRLLDHAATNTRCTMGEALIEGTEGTLTLLGDGSVHLRAFGSLDTEELLTPSTAKGFGGDCVLHLQSHVVDALLSGAALENEASDYLAVVAIEEAIYRSSETGAWVAPAL